METVIAYKLCRKLKDGSLTSLFINKKSRLPMRKWLKAGCYPTTGFAVRPYWHAVPTMYAPHLSMRGRVWVKVELKDFTEVMRPESHGGRWFLAGKMRILEEISNG